jgi:cytochrome c5
LEKNHDKVFYVTFSAVIGALVAITFICVIAARWVTPALAPDAEALARLDERIRPVGSAITDPALLVKTSAKVARAPQTADQIMNGVCASCHNSGLLGAPKVGDKAAWTARVGAGGGLKGLTDSAIKGRNAMPPRGGDLDLSDDEIKSTVQLMLKQSGV